MLARNGSAGARYEMKYIVSESKALAIRDFLRPHLLPDEYAINRIPPGYCVHSLYLDATNFPLYRQTVNGEKDRFKLRIRFYDEEDDSPAFLEIKQRSTDAISKSRACVRRKSAEAFLQGSRFGIDDLMSDDVRSKAALFRFCELCDLLEARGSIFVSYRREAYVHPTAPGLRVTFDRALVGAPYQEGGGLTLPSTPRRAEVGGVILELKYVGQFPSWMGRLVQTFNLQRRSVPKYVECFDVVPRALLPLRTQLA